MSEPTIERVVQILDGSDEPDDALRATVAALVEMPGVTWAGIAFVEGADLVLGPAAGTPDEAARTRVPVVYQDAPVGELWVDGAGDPTLFEQVAEHLAAYVLLGWDTGGEAWEP